MTDAEQLKKTSEEMGIRKLAVALYNAIEGIAKIKDMSPIDVSLNFVQIESVVQDEIAKI